MTSMSVVARCTRPRRLSVAPPNDHDRSVLLLSGEEFPYSA
jgi:hypothetical protein